MLHQSPLSEPPQEEPFIGDPRPDTSAAGKPGEPASSAEGADSRDRGKLIALGAMGALVAVGIGLIIASPRRPGPPGLAVTTADHAANTNADPAKEASQEANNENADPGPRKVRPSVWRASALRDDPKIELSEGTFGKRGLVATLTQAGLPRAEIRRLVQSFEGVHRLDRPRETDAFVLAKDKSSGTVIAFEYVTSPVDVWQGRTEDESGGQARIIVQKLDLFVEHRRAAHGFVVNGDFAKAIAAAGMRPEIVDAVDDALAGHVDPGAIRAGVRMRVAATEDWVEGTFVRVKVDAIEFVPKTGAPLRVYFYERDPREVAGSSRRAPAAGFYDAKGRQPYTGQFRSPLPLARVTSRFNPKRRHPVLKVVMPHQGVDYAGSTGTPVYASAGGTVLTAANAGPCGNMVEIDHGGGINTIYCHMKGFAHGVRSGLKVEAKQLIGYVGQTGRVTGPHLHFGVKKKGIYIDPLGLKMDGIRVLPPADRDAFQRRRADLDAIIDGVALPSAADVPDDNDDKDLHAE